MNSFTRRLGLGFLALAMLGIGGCSQDNETEVQKLSKGMGDPGEGTTKIDPSKYTTQEGPAGYPTSERKQDMGKSYPLANKKKP